MISIASCSRLAVAAICLTASCAYASDIYKWTDADGNVHYEDRPTAASERMDIVSRPTDPAAVAARRAPQDVAEPEEAPVVETAPPAEEKPLTRAERNQQRQEKAAKCNEARERLQRHTVARRMYRVDENGERVYFNDTEIQEARDRAQQKVDELCGS